jgi:DNA-binding beta-propeller fold protein YncE
VATVSATGVVTRVGPGATRIEIATGAATTSVAVTSTDIATRPLGSQTYGVAISPAGVVYVAQPFVGRLTRFDLPSTRPSATVPVGGGPVDVAFSADGATAFVANPNGNAVNLVDVATNAERSRVPLRSPNSLLLSADGARLYVGSGTGVLYFLRASDGVVLDSITLAGGRSIDDLARHPTLPLIYASSWGARRVWEISTETRTVTRTFAPGLAPEGLVVSPDGTELYIADLAGPLLVWDLTTGTRAASVDDALYAEADIVMSPDGSRLFMPGRVSGLGSGLFVVDRAARRLLRFIPLNTVLPHGIAVDATGSTVLVTDEGGQLHFIPRSVLESP